MCTANILKNGEAFPGYRKKLSTGEDIYKPAYLPRDKDGGIPQQGTALQPGSPLFGILRTGITCRR